MAHQIFVGIAQDVVAVGAVPGKVEGGVLEDGNEVGEAVHHLLAAAEFGGVVEVGEVGQLVGIGQRGDDLLVDLVADVRLALERNHVLEAGALRDDDGSERNAGIFVADVFDEQKDEDIVLVLAGIHAATQFVAALPERGVEFRFFQRHTLLCYCLPLCEWFVVVELTLASQATPSTPPCREGRGLVRMP